MPLVVKDRVRETTTTLGTGTITLAGAVAGFQSFSAIGNGNTTYYTINLPGANEWEVGIGTYTASGTTLSRDTILASSNGGSAVNFSAGTKDVFCTYPAGKSAYLDAANNLLIGTNTNTNTSNIVANGTISETVSGTQYLVASQYDVGTNPNQIPLNQDLGDMAFQSSAGVSVGILAATTIDTTNLEVTNIKAKDGTAAITLADSTGVATFSANPILNAGTDNGVVYLNASKVATTGSALTYNGTELGTTSTGLNINNASALVRFQNGSGTRTGYFQVRSDAFDVWSDQAAVPMVFGVANAEKMRLGAATGGVGALGIGYTTLTSVGDSGLAVLGNVGIGTSSPGAKLDVNGGTNSEMRLTTSGSGYLQIGQFTNGAFIGTSSSDPTAGKLRLGTGGVVKASIDPTGTLNIVGAGTAGSTQAISFNGSTPVDTLVTTSAGYVGIGANSPAYKLDVNSGNALAFVRFATSTSNNGAGVVLAGAVSGQKNWVIANQYNVNGGLEFTQTTANGGSTISSTPSMLLDASGNLGIGTTSPTYKLDVRVSGATTTLDGINLGNGTAGAIFQLSGATYSYRGVSSNNLWIGTNSGHDMYIGPSTANVIKFGTAAFEQMRLTSTGTLNIVGAGTAGSTQAISFNGSTPVDTLVTTSGGNVGIGIDAPVEKLHVQSSANTIGSFRSSGASYVGIEAVNSSRAYSLLVRPDTSNALVIRDETASANRVILDTSGNLGLGVTPSAWTTYVAQQIGNGSIANYSPTQDMRISSNAYYASGSWKRIAASYAIQYLIDGSVGAHIWYNAGTSTADSTISFTQAMTLDASGRLLVGTTSNFGGAGQFAIDQSGGTIPIVHLIGTASVGGGQRTVGLTFSGVINDTGPAYGNLAQVGAGKENATQGNTAGYLSFATTPNGGSLTERARITSSGELVVGFGTANVATITTGAAIGFANTANTSSFDVGLLGGSSDATAYVYQRANSAMVFATNSTERARITSGGYFKASNTGTYVGSTGAYHELVSNESGTAAVYVRNSDASSPVGIDISYSAASPNGTGNTFIYCQDSTALRASIRSNGGLANYQSNNVDLSDIRTKTDINPLGSYWNKIAGLEIVTYKYKDQTHDDLNIGVIAQQVEAVAPEFVDSDGFGDTPEDGVPLKTIYNKDLTFAAIKALQEAMARIETLEAEVAALKGA